MSKKMTLWEIGDDMQALYDLLDEIGGDVTDPRVDEAISGWFDEIEGNIKHKVDGYCGLIAELESRADFRSFEADRLNARAKVDRNTAGKLRSRLMLFLQIKGMKKLETPRWTVAIANNGGLLPIDIHDPDQVPVEFCRHIPERWEPDKQAIRDAIQRGEEVPGAVAMERGQHLRMK